MKSKIIPLLYVQRHVWCMPFEILFLCQNNHMKTPFVFIEVRDTSIFSLNNFYHSLFSLCPFSFFPLALKNHKQKTNKQKNTKTKQKAWHTHTTHKLCLGTGPAL